MKKTQHRIPRNFVQSPRIDPIVHAQLNSKVDELTLQLVESKDQLLDQAKRHQTRVTELKDKIAAQEKQLTPVLGVSDFPVNHGFLVSNWQSGWKWLSNWLFVLIAYVSVYGVPNEILALVPEASQAKVTGVLALLGFICRFINQSKPKLLRPVTEDL